MGDLTYLIILLVVINLVGRIFRAIQKSASAGQAPGTKPADAAKQAPGAAARPAAKSRPKPKDPFAVLAERLEKIEEFERVISRAEEPPQHPYAERATEQATPEIVSAETASDFARETAATREAQFESTPRGALHEESFPWQETQYGYRAPVRPVAPAPGPERAVPRSYRDDIVRMLRNRESVRSAILLATILGPPRSLRGYRGRKAMER